MKTIWRPIYKKYAISNMGGVKRLKTKTSPEYLFRLNPADNGYIRVILRINGRPVAKLVHRLVAEAFLGKCPRGYIVNHKDGCRYNNGAPNLQYISQSENISHAYSTGLRKSGPLGQTNGATKLTPSLVRKIRKSRKTQAALAKEFHVCVSQINNIIHKRVWAWV